MNRNKSPETFDPNPVRNEDMVFYYSREHRLARASETVRGLNAAAGKKKGFFSVLTTNKSQGFLLISIVVMSAMIMMVSIFLKGDTAEFGGNRVAFSAFRFQGSSYLALKKTAPKKGGAYTGAVNIAISPAPDSKDAAVSVVTRTVFFSLEIEEEFRMMLPFESDEILVLAEVPGEDGRELKQFKVKVQ
ncbi:MAG: hypothetical protein LBK64_02545 [Spirochaetaceae bacterium]|jgi:hypothetical protein|nr:hypothetical protein [Spirochaetaceae bacterium]